jgi:hypothetical protein
VARLVHPDEVAPRVGEREPPAARIVVELGRDPGPGGLDAGQGRLSVRCPNEGQDALAPRRNRDGVQPTDLLAGIARVLDPGVLTAIVVEGPTQGLRVEGLRLLEVVDRELDVIQHVRHAR